MSVTLTPDQAASWSQWVTNFDGAVSQTRAAYNRLLGLQSVAQQMDAATRARYNQLISDGQNQLQALTNLQQQRNSVASWLSSVGQGISSFASGITTSVENVASGAWTGLQNAWNSLFAPKSQSMGVVPIIVVGVSIVAAAAVVYAAIQWAQQAQAESARLEEMHRLQAQGQTPAQAAAIVAQTLGPPGTALTGAASILGFNPTPLMLGIGALIILPSLLGVLRRR